MLFVEITFPRLHQIHLLLQVSGSDDALVLGDFVLRQHLQGPQRKKHQLALGEFLACKDILLVADSHLQVTNPDKLTKASTTI